MDPTLVTALLVFLAFTLGTISLVLVLEWLRERFRAKNVVRKLESWAKESLDRTGSDAILADTGGVQNRWLGPVIARIPQLRDLEALLGQGATKWSVTTFVLMSLGLGVALGLATWLFSQILIAGVIAAVLAGMVPYTVARRRARRRMQAFEEILPEGIDLIGRAIRAGHPLSAGIKMVADEARDPVASEFRRVFEEQRFGLAFEDSLFGLADRIRLVDVRILITAILVQREVGGNLAEVLDNLASVVRERFKIRRQLRVITAQGRLSGYVLALLPIAVGFAIYLLNAPYLRVLFNHPTGRLLLVLAITLQILGYLWIRRIVNIDI